MSAFCFLLLSDKENYVLCLAKRKFALWVMAHSLYVIHKEGLSPSSGGIIRLMMMTQMFVLCEERPCYLRNRSTHRISIPAYAVEQQ
jgi:hypothetical protein